MDSWKSVNQNHNILSDNKDYSSIAQKYFEQFLVVRERSESSWVQKRLSTELLWENQRKADMRSFFMKPVWNKDDRHDWYIFLGRIQIKVLTTLPFSLIICNIWIKLFLISCNSNLNLQLDRNMNSSSLACFRFSNVVLRKKKWRKEKWQCSQNLDLNATCDFDGQRPGKLYHITRIEHSNINNSKIGLMPPPPIKRILLNDER